MGGEKSITFLPTAKFQGSPPHGRGKGRIFPRGVSAQGITPAWAGKRHRRFRSRCPVRDHPRMGGEKAKVLLSSSLKGGSPPHGRGKDIVRDGPDRLGGITPAWAGKSRQPAGLGQRAKDHPRMGGEKLFGIWIVTSVAGSPPHGRGKV